MIRDRQAQYSTIRTEGGLLPSDLLQRVAQGDAGLGGLRPTDYHLAEGEKVNEHISRSWNRLLGVWETFHERVGKLDPTDSGATETRERWLLILFQELGYGRLSAHRAGVEISGKNYPISHFWQQVPIHFVGWNIDIDHRSANVKGAPKAIPHSLVQEFLNRSDEHLWAFVSNGRRLRILRDNVSLTRQAYVEFDLESMMEGEVYSDFAIFWLLCHQSRVESRGKDAEAVREVEEGEEGATELVAPSPATPSNCWLEKWSQAAKQQGVRALDRLREGVELAISALGSGFIEHSGNGDLRENLRSGKLDKQDYYRQLLRIVYRLVFLFVAEDRELLLSPTASADARKRYEKFYSVSRLRQLATKHSGTAHVDLWRGLWLVMEKLGCDAGCAELGLPALGSFLWSVEAVPDLAACDIANRDVLAAFRALSTTVDGRILRPIDYRNLGSEELGSIYESLLELHPELSLVPASFSLSTASGHERKTTGSYYTPSSLITCLLDSALDPVLDEATRKKDPEEAILDLKVCDPACGSGHFLVAAAHRIAKRLATVITGDEEPSPDSYRTALRNVIGHCIYGVDLNPISVELCKVSLWMEALEPGKPLSFLDHHIQCGNSLLGSTPEFIDKGVPDEAFASIEGDDKVYCRQYKKQNKEERLTRQTFLEQAMPWERLGNLAAALYDLDHMVDDTIEGVKRKQARYVEYIRSSDYLYGRLLADAWCAAFVWKKHKDENLPFPITEGILRRIEKNPHWTPHWMREEIQQLAAQYRFFHWHLAFPEVFQPDASRKSGFDVILGNPPWERVKIQKKEWFAERCPEVAKASNSAARTNMITALERQDPVLHAAWKEATRQAEGESHFIRDTSRYPLCGRGDINTYAIFAELNCCLTASDGRVGCIVPSGIATDDTTKFFFQDLMQSQSIVSLLSFDNKEGLFPAVKRSTRFCLITLTGSARPTAALPQFVFYARRVEDLADSQRHFSLSLHDIALLNPNSLTCPVFRSKNDAEITKRLYRRVPVLWAEGPPEINPWGLSFLRMLDMANDSGLFRSAVQLEQEGWSRVGSMYLSGDLKYAPLYEAKMTGHFDHRSASYETETVRDFTPAEKNDPERLVLPRYWVSSEDVKAQLHDRWEKGWLLGWQDVTDVNTMARTVNFAIMPRVGVGHTAPLMFTDSETDSLKVLVANFSSFVFDYIARQKIGGVHLTYQYLKQLPVLLPTTYVQVPGWCDSSQTLRDWLVPRVLELTYTAWDLESFAQDCGWLSPPFHWDEERRFQLRCELDSAFFHLYLGTEDEWRQQPDDLIHAFPTPRHALDYIMETFSIVKRKDIQRHGDYRTKRQILEIYDAMQHAIDRGEPYKTLLYPPPADPSVCHPPKTTAL